MTSFDGVRWTLLVSFVGLATACEAGRTTTGRVELIGTGTGVVMQTRPLTSLDPGDVVVHCPALCETSFVLGGDEGVGSVTLAVAAAAARDSVFVGWEGECVADAADPTQATMVMATAVVHVCRARFDLAGASMLPGWRTAAVALGVGHAPSEVALASRQGELYASVVYSENPTNGEGGGGGRTIAPLWWYRPVNESWKGFFEARAQAAGEYVGQPHLAIAPDGTVYLSRLYSDVQGGARIRLDSVPFGGDTLVTRSASVDPSGQFPLDSGLAIDDAGGVHVGWIGAGGGYLRSYTPSTNSWGDPILLSQSAARPNEIAVAAGARVHVVLVEPPGPATPERVAEVFTMDDDGQLVLRGTLNDVPASTIRALSAAVDGNDDLLIAYEEAPASGMVPPPRVRIKRLPEGAAVSDASDLSPRYARAGQTQLAIDRSGEVVFGLIEEADAAPIISQRVAGAWVVLDRGLAARAPTHDFAIAPGPTDEGGPRGVARLISSGQGAAARADAETYEP